MPEGPMAIMPVLGACAPRLSRRVFASVQRWLVGAMRAPGPRPVTAVLRVLGPSAAAHVQHAPRVRNRAPWSSLDASRRLWGWRLAVCVPEGPVVLGLAETSARRRGARIAATGLARAPGRSSPAHVVQASGWRWGRLMGLARIPWVDRGWALPFMPGLARSDRSDQGPERRPPAWRDRARQRVRLGRRWGPRRALVGVGDRPDAALEWLEAGRARAWVSTRVRLDAALYPPAPPRTPTPNGRPRKPGRRRPTRTPGAAAPTTPWKRVTVAPWDGQQARRVHITSATAGWEPAGLPPVPMRWVLIRDPAGQVAPPAVLATHLALEPWPRLTWFIHRWRLEPTGEEARPHRGLDTPRQWHARSVRRTTPAWCGGYSLVTLAAAHLRGGWPAPVRTTAWSPTPQATCADAMA